MSTLAAVFVGATAADLSAQAQGTDAQDRTNSVLTPYAPMLRGDTAATSNGWNVTALATVSESAGAYQPVGILDGIGAFNAGPRAAWVFVNHELSPNNGYAYTLANGTQMTGARVSLFKVSRSLSGGVSQWSVDLARPAFDTIYDRDGVEVTDPAQINETGNNIDGIARLCSAFGVEAGTYGFVDNIFLTGEETGKPFHPHGGTEFVLDCVNGELWAAPALGRMAWENVTPLETGDPNTVALLCGDDSVAAPLYLYIGQKNAQGNGSFLDRNGLAVGKVYAWKADDGSLTPEDFNGFNEVRTGTWVEITVQDVAMAGMPGYDAAGYADIDTMQGQADALGCFSFSRPEDVHVNPLDGTQAVMATTGRGSLYPSDDWGQLLIVDTDFATMTATCVIIHDGDDLPDGDFGVRSPDNLTWANDGKIYVQEDRSTSLNTFGGSSGIEASVWVVDPITRAYTRIAEIDRSAVAPVGSTDSGAGDIGNWETSGILDITHLVPSFPGERVLIATVQAHGIRDGLIGDNPLLDEGGQLVILSNKQ